MKRLILVLVCLFLITPSQAEGKKNGQTKDIQYQLKIQKERLNDIEEQVSIEQRQIETWYERHFNELRKLVERKAKQLKLDNRALWTEFINMHEQTSPFDTYFKMNDRIPNASNYYMNTTLDSPIATTSTILIRNTETFNLRAAMVDSYFLNTVTNLFLNPNFHKRLVELADGSAYNSQSLLIRKDARQLLHIVDEFQTKLKILQNRKTTKLAALEQRRQSLRADVLRVIQDIKAGPETVNEGTISAIMYSQNSPLCMIDGIDNILREGDSIGNIVIVKIQPDHVQFAREGQKWTQQVGKAASDFWK